MRRRENWWNLRKSVERVEWRMEGEGGRIGEILGDLEREMNDKITQSNRENN